MLISANFRPQAQPAPFEAGARGDETGNDAHFAASAPTLLPRVPAGPVIGYWDELFRSVKARLRSTVDEWPAAATAPDFQQSTGRTRADVLACVASLDQLHSTLAHEAALRHQLQMEVFDAQAALAQARAELAGTQAQESRARHLALHDELTQLPNRSFFRERMEHALAQREQQGQSLALLTLDLDGFKLINDAHGHDTGDAVLRIVAARLARAVRATDMVSRLGGDEFACLMANLHSRDQLSRLACKLFDAVSAPLKTGKLTFNVCPSIGIAIGPSDGVTAEALLESADGAMVRAKRQQTVYAFFDRRVDA